MSREAILQKLEAYKARFDDELDTVERFIQFIGRQQRCFERSLSTGHVTGSAWLVDESREQVLLTHHKKLDRWLQLGGHADGDSNILNVALREVQEESGLMNVRPLGEAIFDLDVHLIPERGDEVAHYHYDIRYAFQAEGQEEYIISEESHDLSWVKIEALSTFTEDESMLRMARKWMARKSRRDGTGCG